ncbi:hypothetical protein NEMBOFW57_003972 [Staphylotrichum longicolle]|uniref:2EXR domain-containing protein n=1 Tax=Staphylotrichum longicolle TaxID=669026 RepID=A0AAD4I371_9PEZI|nr:hypothetical protein NEMBOFW57_003972 [Staphylotrichum longicolle]
MSITTTTVTITTTTTTTTTTPLTFPLFPLLPTELRDLIWSAAASLAPQIQFFLNPHHPSSRLFEPCEAPINLVPHPESGAHNTVSLSLACRDARAAVQRHAKTARMAGGKRTVLRTTLGPQVQFYGGWGASASSSLALAPRTAVNLDFELERDVVCFGGPEADGAGVWDIIDWGEGNHILFDAVRRFAAWVGAGAGRGGAFEA